MPDLAGVLTLEDALRLVVLRGRLIQNLPVGSMLSVALDEQELLPLLDGELSLAAVNSPTQSVVSGPAEAINALEQKLTLAGIATARLQTSHAFHSAMLDPVLDEFQCAARDRVQASAIPFVPNVTGTWITQAEATDPEYWVRHMRHTVRFGAGLEEIFKQPERVLLEVGPGRTLSILLKRHLGRALRTAGPYLVE